MGSTVLLPNSHNKILKGHIKKVKGCEIINVRQTDTTSVFTRTD